MKKIKKIIVVLIVILLSLIAFVGIFKKENGVWKNAIPDYQYGMELEGQRELVCSLNTEESEKYVYVDEAGNVKGEVCKDGNAITKEEETTEETSTEQTEDTEKVPYTKETRMIKQNSDASLTKENFEQAKKIIQKRLNEQKISEYHIRMDDVTGKLVVEGANDNDKVDQIKQLVLSAGKFEIIDYQNGLILMDNSDIKKASVVYSNQEAYNTYLQIEFNKEGTEKLREISTKYIEIESEDEGETENEEEETQEEDKHNHLYVSIVFDGTKMMTTYFGEEMPNGILQIAVGQARNNYEEFKQDYDSAKTIADMLNSGVLPVVYELENDNFVKSEIELRNAKITIVSMLAVISFIYILKFKKNGLMAAVLNIGYIAVLSLILKYTNVEITVNGIIAGIVMLLMNAIYVGAIFKEWQTKSGKQAYQEASKKFYLTIIPLIVVAIVFTFVSYSAISSTGMVVFWGIVLNGLYNFLFTRTVLEK